jgi:transcriptional regulator with XRE-family HTH domain
MGKVFRKCRTELGLSQDAFAHKVGLHRTYIGGIERGERNVSLTNLLKLSQAIGMPLSEVLEMAESMASEAES